MLDPMPSLILWLKLDLIPKQIPILSSDGDVGDGEEDGEEDGGEDGGADGVVAAEVTGADYMAVTFRRLLP